MGPDEIAQYLDALKREECYRVDAVLKESANETTQRVSFIGANGAESGPFIRKFIQRESGMGSAYELIFAAQQAGKRFKYVPRIVECYNREGQIVVVMEYVRGETLQDYVYRCDPSVPLAESVFPQLCDAVAELHEGFDQPVIHRDLKPSNIILSDGGLAIIDFGIAREYKSNADIDTVHFGTREFAPPEQFGFGQTTVRSDVYALGMVLFFCLTEKIPTASIREAGFRDDRIPEPLRDVIVQATAFAPEQRFKSARALKAAFASALGLCNGGENVSHGVSRSEPAAAVAEGVPEPPRSTRVHESTPSPMTAQQPTQQPGRSDAAPVFTEAAPGTPARQPKKNRLSARNAVVLVFTVLFLIADLSAFVNPTDSIQQNPFWYNFIAFGLIGPLFFLSAGYTCADKNNLAALFPQLARVKSWHLWVATVVVLFAGAAITTALGYKP